MSAKLRSIKNFGKVIKWKYLIFAQIILMNVVTNFINVPAVDASSCHDVEFFFARGSGEPIGGASYTKWREEIENQLVKASITYDFHELGDDKNSFYEYPATPVSGDFWGYVNLVNAYFSGGEAFAFGASVKQGQQELLSRTAKITASCPRTKFVLGGYSQGAMVMTKTLPQLSADQVIYVTNFGDPKLYLREGANMDGLIPKVPDACSGKNLSEYRTYVPDCWAYEGVLGSQRPYRPEGYIGKVGTWCNQKDIMCSSGMNIEDHSKYISENLYADSARKIYQKLTDAFPSKFPAKQPSALHNVLFLLDSTGSMGDLFAFYRPTLKAMASQIFQAGGSVAAFGYKDSLTERSSWPFCDFGCDERTFLSHLSYYVAMGGGDAAEESLLSALYLSMGDLEWQWGATKSIVVVTDTGYHAKDFGNIDLPQVIQRSLAIDPVNIYVIALEELAETYADLTDSTNGKFFGLKTLTDTNQATNQNIIQDATRYIINRPVAQLGLSEYYGIVGNEITFDASQSYSLNHSELRYEWDLDGDGDFELESTDAKISKIYDQVFAGHIQVRVSDEQASSTMSAYVSIQPQLEAPAEISTLTYEKSDDDTYDVTFTSDAPDVLLSIDDATLGFVRSSQVATRQANTTTFPVKGITQTSTLILTPYSATGRRGTSRSLEIAITDDHGTDSPNPGPINPSQPDTPNPPRPEEITPPQTDPVEPTPGGSQVKPINPAGKSPTTTSSEPSNKPAKPVKIPKVPETGTYDRRLLCQD